MNVLPLCSVHENHVIGFIQPFHDLQCIALQQCDAIFDKCARGEYASSDALRAEVALAVFNANKGSKTHKKETFTTPIAKPVEIKSEKNMSAMDKLKLYVGRE